MEYKTPIEIAEEMKLNPETVRRMCKRGDMYDGIRSNSKVGKV